MNDVVLNKKASIERCVRQARKYYSQGSEEVPLKEDFLRQDAIAMNLQRACEQCIDLGNHVIMSKKLGLPQSSRDTFRILEREGIVAASLSEKLQKMVGFRNSLVHEYQKLDIELMEEVISKHLGDLIDFTSIIARFLSE